MNRDPFRQAANRLNRAAPPGERVAYVNPAEENLMMAFGGSGRSVNGIPSYAPTMADYGAATREALETQLALVTGEEVGDVDYGDILPKGMESIVGYERPGRLAAAQLDTDVLRRTLLGGDLGTADSQGRILEGYETPPGAPRDVVYMDGVITDQVSGTPHQIDDWLAEGGYTTKKNTISHQGQLTVLTPKGEKLYGITDGKSPYKVGKQIAYMEIKEGVGTSRIQGSGTTKNMVGGTSFGGLGRKKTPAPMPIPESASTKFISAHSTDTGQEVTEATPIYQKDPETGAVISDEWLASDAGGNRSGRAGKVVRAGEGALDLYGPSQAAMTTKEIGSEAEQYGEYVKRDTELMKWWNDPNVGGDQKEMYGGDIAAFGKAHWDAFGKQELAEGRRKEGLPEMGETYQVSRRAGFDPTTNEFLGLTTYGADVSEQLARKQRAGDIYDVEQLGPRATEAYRQQGVQYDAAGNAIAGTGIAGTLAEARRLGPGGAAGYSAMPSFATQADVDEGRAGAVGDFFTGAATADLHEMAQGLGRAEHAATQDDVDKGLAAMVGDTIGVPDITGGRMGDFDPLREALPPPEPGVGQLTPREGTGPAFLQGTGLNFRGSSAAPRLAAQPAGGPVEGPQERIYSAPEERVAAYKQADPARPAPRARSDGSYSDDGGATWRSPTGEVVTQEDLIIGPAAAPPPTTTNRLRGAMLSQVQEGLGQGLTEREKRNLREASRARATAMGRTYDPTSTIDELKIQLMEDEARRGRNLAQAQSILGGEAGIQQSDLARNLQAQMANLQTQQAGIGRELGAAESDVERAMRQQAMEEQYRQAGLGQERAAAASMVGLEQATGADPFQAILGRPSGAGVGVGQQVMNTAQYGLGSAPSFITPQTGLSYISAENAAKASMYGAEQEAAAARSAGKQSMLGSILGGVASAIPFCWGAREAYGADNPKWLRFREWMLNRAPDDLREYYLEHGPAIAENIRHDEPAKASMRDTMDAILEGA